VNGLDLLVAEYLQRPVRVGEMSVMGMAEGAPAIFLGTASSSPSVRTLRHLRTIFMLEST
jgi:hypothetical protein